MSSPAGVSAPGPRGRPLLGSLLDFRSDPIGFLMAAYDDECRALHDRICDTRVVRK